MEIFFTDSGALGSAVAGAVDGVVAARRATAFASRFVPDEMPFVLLPDGRYEPVVNRFLRSLPVLGVRSPRSWRAYAFDLVVWGRFLAEQRSRTLLEAGIEDVRAFHAARRLSQPPFLVSAATWNRMVAALEKFYDWACGEGLISKSPLGTAVRGRTDATGGSRPKEKASRSGDVKFLSLPKYAAFRDVGLRGRTTRRDMLAGSAGRCAERNAVFAELLVTTGLRLQEAGSLLACELPAIDPSEGARSAKFELAAPTAKGGRGRTVWIPHRVLRQLADYVEIERPVTMADPALAREGTSRLIMARQADRRGGQVLRGSEWVPVRWSALGPRLRSRLVLVDADDRPVGPLALWTSERGTPMSLRSWESVFERASRRCSRLGLDIEASPHTLRHTFAVHMLTRLVRQQIAALHTGSADLRYNAYQRVMGDPLALLQRLLGHARIATTYVYLDAIGDVQQLIDEAVGGLADQLHKDVTTDLLEVEAAR